MRWGNIFNRISLRTMTLVFAQVGTWGEGKILKPMLKLQQLKISEFSYCNVSCYSDPFGPRENFWTRD